MIRINPYIVLFHELCHALIEKNLDTFGASYPDLPSCLSKFQSEEEFRVIVGTTVRQFMEFSKKLSEPSDKAEEGRAWERDKKISTEDLEKEFAEADQQESVDIPVFENIMGFIYNQAIRIDLTAVDKPSVLKIAKPKMSKEIFNYFLRIAFSGLLDPMKEFLAINGGEISMCMFNKEYAIAKVCTLFQRII